MDRYGASTREYSRANDYSSDTYYPRRTAAPHDRTNTNTNDSDFGGRYDRPTHRGLPTRHGGGTAIDRFATSDDDDKSEYEPRGGRRGGVAGVRTNGTRRRREDPVIEQLRREVREDEARCSGSRFGGDYSDDDDNDDSDSEFAHHTVTPRARGGTSTRAGSVLTGNGSGNNGGTHRRHRREDPVIEQLRREVREDEARLSGSRGGGHYSDDSEGETEFGRRLEREVRAGRRGNGVRTPPSRGHFDDSEDEGVHGGRRGGFCGDRPSRV